MADINVATSEGTKTNTSPFSSSSQDRALETVNIGTRRSVLARIQTDIILQALKQQWPDKTYNIHAISTMGDKDQVTPLHELAGKNETQGGKSLWTFELEGMLVGGAVDMIVHSLKGKFGFGFGFWFGLEGLDYALLGLGPGIYSALSDPRCVSKGRRWER